jgi:hypothetical protein
MRGQDVADALDGVEKNTALLRATGGVNVLRNRYHD